VTVQARDSEVLLTAKPEPVWLETMAAAQCHTGERAMTYRAIVGAIALPTAFVALRHEGQLASLAYGAIHHGFLMCESVITGAAYRKRGYARRVVATLLAWGAEQKAHTACLQVQTDNMPAVRLYGGLGLKTTLYSYHYRRAPIPSVPSPHKDEEQSLLETSTMISFHFAENARQYADSGSGGQIRFESHGLL
jgi:N-acetylglutamate synthase